MNYYIFDKEKKELLTDDDGELMKFPSNEEVWHYLKLVAEFSADFIHKNFFALRGEKILEVEDLKLKSLAEVSRENCPVKLVCQCGADANWDGFCKFNPKQ